MFIKVHLHLGNVGWLLDWCQTEAPWKEPNSPGSREFNVGIGHMHREFLVMREAHVNKTFHMTLGFKHPDNHFWILLSEIRLKANTILAQ